MNRDKEQQLELTALREEGDDLRLRLRRVTEVQNAAEVGNGEIAALQIKISELTRKVGMLQFNIWRFCMLILILQGCCARGE
jgi:hypothetical protein